MIYILDRRKRDNINILLPSINIQQYLIIIKNTKFISHHFSMNKPSLTYNMYYARHDIMFNI